MEGGNRCHSAGKPKSMPVPHSDTRMDWPERVFQTWPEGCRRLHPLPSGHLPSGLGTYQHSDGAMKGAHGLQRLTAIFIPVLPLHTHGDERFGIGIYVVLFI